MNGRMMSSVALKTSPTVALIRCVVGFQAVVAERKPFHHLELVFQRLFLVPIAVTEGMVSSTCGTSLLEPVDRQRSSFRLELLRKSRRLRRLFSLGR